MAASLLSIPPVIHPDELAHRLETSPDVRLLDVCPPAQPDTIHIRGAYNVPRDLLGEHGPEIRATVAEPVVLICQSGQRVRTAEAALGGLLARLPYNRPATCDAGAMVRALLDGSEPSGVGRASGRPAASTRGCAAC